MSRRVDRVRTALEDAIGELGALDVCDPRHMHTLAEAALTAAELPLAGHAGGSGPIAINIMNMPEPSVRPVVVARPRPCPRCGLIS